MRYHNITKDDMLNGDGLRTVLWVSGCCHGCPECHNPVTWDTEGGLPFDEAAKKELFQELSKSYISGVTLSGGDPLHPQNREEIGSLAEELKHSFPDKTIWLYTGYLWEEIKELPLLKFVDIVVDGKYDKDLADLKIMWKGSRNQRVIHVLKSLDTNEVVLHCQ